MEQEPFDQRVRRLAVHSIGRGCFFAALAIWCVMIGLISDPKLALRAGGLLSLVACCILLLKAQSAQQRSFKHTEVWILLDRKLPQAGDLGPKLSCRLAGRMTPEAAQQLIGAVLRELYLRYALYAGLIGAAFLLLSVFILARSNVFY